MLTPTNSSHIEILAPAGDFDSVVAAVRCGADAVYLGGTRLNARKGASNFDLPLLKKTISYCKARDVAVHLTLNTIVFDDEIEEAVLSIQEAAKAGVDALIVQDLTVASLAKKLAPSLPLHASTQLSVHNLEGVLALSELGFSRAVIARELSLSELEHIVKHSPIAVETFVHGALCMSLSGQCYLSGMIGGRSGNRGRCAQPCRLPFASTGATHALSLKDLSEIQYLPLYQDMGMASLKIEGRLKRPEYVAAAVTACVQARNGETPDYAVLEAVFSRSGFTDGYATGALGDNMFGTRRRQDVVSAQDTFQQLAGLYHQETPLVPVSFSFTAQAGKPSALTVTDTQGNEVSAENQVPAPAKTAPLDHGRAAAALERTGGTPFYPTEIDTDIQDGIFLPAAALNALRRDCLDQLLAQRGAITPHPFTPFPLEEPSYQREVPKKPRLRLRFSSIQQLSPELADKAEYLIFPLSQLTKESLEVLSPYKEKIIFEVPSYYFGDTKAILDALSFASQQGFGNIMLGNLSGITLSENFDFALHGDFTLNTVNRTALEQYALLGFSSMTMSVEYGLSEADTRSPIPRGIVAYGWLPAMVFRNHPSGMEGKNGTLTDRMGVEFFVEKQPEVSVLYNSVPLTLADRKNQLQGLDFITFYFTRESKEQCQQIASDFLAGKTPEQFTRGSYFSRVL